MEELDGCPVCGGGEGWLVSRHGRDFQGQAIQACAACGVFYQSPRPGAEELSRYYRGEYSRRFRGREEPTGGDLEWRDRIAEYRFRYLRRSGLLAAGDSVLEIGCGAGNFLRLCRDAGLRAWGVEPSEGYSDHARKQGLEVATGMFPEHHGGRERYRHVVLFHVLEHLPRPVETLRHCRGMLEDGGRVIVEVPDLSRALGPSFTERYFHYPHLIDFTAESLDGALARAGLRRLGRHYPPEGRRRHHLLVVAAAAQEGGEVPAPAPATTEGLVRRVRRRVRLAVALRPLREALRRVWR